jgi:hypothetical protein
MMNTGTAPYFGSTNRPDHAGLGEHHVTALGPNVAKTVGFKKL